MPKTNYSPIIIFALFYLIIDSYVVSGIKVLFLTITTESQLVVYFWWVFSLSVLFYFTKVFSKALSDRKMNSSFQLALNIFLALLFSKLVFIAFLFTEDVYRAILYFSKSIFHHHMLFPMRSIWFSSLGFLTSLSSCFVFIFGITSGKYHYKVHHQTLYFDDLPEAFDGFTIAQISDIHAGSFDNPKEVLKGIHLINAQKPDLFLFTGDLVNNKASEIEPYLELFKQIKAPYGCFSVLGNHDYGDYMAWPNQLEKDNNLKLLKTYHRELGYELLLDEHRVIHKNGQHISVVGVENWGHGFGQRGDLEKALNGLRQDDFKVLLSHDPSHWDAEVKSNPLKIHLTLSGHTHGMQFGIEIGNFKWSPVKYRYPNWAGLAHFNGRYLYVNRGFGFLGFSGRIGIWPEITIINLKRNDR
ncbi:MAG: phosphohydrolase [Sphingobacteriales bacterium]|nr:phosphohydrolase [Sphingobacteriales bacterium]